MIFISESKQGKIESNNFEKSSHLNSSFIYSESERNEACFKRATWDFHGGRVVKNPPSNAGDTGSIPGWGTKIPPAVAAKPLCLNYWDSRPQWEKKPMHCDREHTHHSEDPCMLQLRSDAAKKESAPWKTEALNNFLKLWNIIVKNHSVICSFTLVWMFTNSNLIL